MLKPKTVVVADDEEVIRHKLVRFLHANGYAVLGEAKTGEETKSLVQQTRPQVLFVDIGMPDGDGYTAAKQLRIQFPDLRIVFITGFPEYAAQSYDLEATDYLVKPFEDERLYQCLKRIEQSLHPINRTPDLSQAALKLGIKKRDAIEVIDQNEIAFISSESKNTKVYLITGRKKFIQTSESLKALEKRIDPNLFLRTHRSFIVNLQHIDRIESSGQSFVIRFQNISDIACVSRSYLLSLYSRLQIKYTDNRMGQPHN